jgi:hypothetical protein
MGLTRRIADVSTTLMADDKKKDGPLPFSDLCQIEVAVPII